MAPEIRPGAWSVLTHRSGSVVGRAVRPGPRATLSVRHGRQRQQLGVTPRTMRAMRGRAGDRGAVWRTGTCCGDSGSTQHSGEGCRLNNKEALQQLLRRKRAEMSPIDLGWPARSARGGRRSVGISQAQTAQALFVSERWYASLERGDMVNPSTEFLDKVAKVLRMEERERAALYVFTLGYEPSVPLDPMAGTNVASAWQQAVSCVTGQPCYINDVAWNVLAANEDFIRMFPQAPNHPPRLPEQNLIRWMLLREDAREHHLVNWEKGWAEPVAAQLRTAVAAHPENKDLQQLDREVSDDPVAGPIYRSHNIDYVNPDGDTRVMRHAGYEAPQGSTDHRTRCCERHAPSQLGNVTMCAAQPFGSLGARFFILVFEPTP